MALELSAGELLHHFRDYLRHCGALMATAVLVLLSCALKGEGPEEVVTFARPEIVAAVYNTFNGGVATVPEGLSFSSTKVYIGKATELPNEYGLTDLLFYVGVGVASSQLIYQLLCGAIQLYYYTLQRGNPETWKCQPNRFLTRSNEWHEIVVGTLNMTLAGSMSGFLSCWILNGNYTSVYFVVGDYGHAYYFLSFVWLFLWFEASAYYSHRLLHTPWLYKAIHKHHHRYHSPTPYSVIAMSPFEMVFYQMFFVAPLFTVPIHASVYIAIELYIFYFGLIDHSGVKMTSWLPWQPDSMFHDDHHKKTVYRLALYQVLAALEVAAVLVAQIQFLNYDSGSSFDRLMNLKRFELLYLLSSLLLPFIIAAIPLTTKTYGLAGSWCWIQNWNNDCPAADGRTGLIQQFVLWTVPSSLILLMIVFEAKDDDQMERVFEIGAALSNGGWGLTTALALVAHIAVVKCPRRGKVKESVAEYRSITITRLVLGTRTLATKKMETQNVQHTRVAVIGAGITGLSVGLCLSQLYRGRVAITVMAERFSPHTTSDSSGGLVIPSFSSYGTRERGKQAGEVANDRLQQWAYVTYDHLRRLCEEEGLRPEDGLMLVPTFKYFEESYPVPEWASHVIDFRSLEATEATALGLRADLFKTVWRFKTFVIDGKRFLPWMTRRVAEMGGKFETRKVTSLKDLCGGGDYDVVINCTGLGSRDLAGDDELYPVKGQVVAIEAPGFMEVHYHHEADLHPEYVIPRTDCVLLGSTTEGDTWSTDTEPDAVEGIYKKCVGLVPRLAGSRIVGSWGCLRPVRHPEVRVEVEEVGGGAAPVVHCYGHGGQGYILHWGTAMEVAGMVGRYLERGGVKSSKL
eukprot:Em0002g1143a